MIFTKEYRFCHEHARKPKVASETAQASAGCCRFFRARVFLFHHGFAEFIAPYGFDNSKRDNSFVPPAEYISFMTGIFPQGP